jgi:hypothetical protein
VPLPACKKNEIAHQTTHPKLLSLAEHLGCDYLKKLKVTHKLK